MALFALGDVDDDGCLDAFEFEDLLRGSGFGLHDSAVRGLMEMADINADGKVDMEVLSSTLSRQWLCRIHMTTSLIYKRWTMITV